MSSRPLAGILLAAVAALGGGPGRAAAPELLPLKDFAAMPGLDNPRISPDGRTIATQLRRSGQAYLVLHDLFAGKPGEPATRTLPLPPKATINWTQWLNDQYLLVSVRKSTKLHRVEFPDDRLYEDVPYDRLYTVDRATRETKAIGPQTGGQSGDDVIYLAPDGSFIVLEFSRSMYSPPVAMRVDLPANKITVGDMAPLDISRWFTNSRGEVVAGIGPMRDGRSKLIYRQTPADRFKTLTRLSTRDDADGTAALYIMQVDAASQTGIVTSRRGGDNWGLYRFDFRTGTYGETLFSSNAADVDEVSFDRNGKLRWASYIDDRRHMKWFDPADTALYEALQKAVPDMVTSVVSSSADNSIRIVRTDSPTNPGTFYVYSEATGKMTGLSTVNAALAGKALAPMAYVAYKARDGLEIHAYLTLPAGRPEKALPLVVLPHPGPFSRDQWQYDYLVQYLANRGYAVLQPNYRGSTGYGRAFEEAGYGQLGKAMQDDLDDGVAWLAAAGTIDPKRVCMVGWSYGGYAAEVAAYRNPGVYRCAVSIAGISDMQAMVRFDNHFMYWKDWEKWSSRLRGEEDSRALGNVSPLRHAREVRIPLLLVHGEDDDVVPVIQSEKMADALKAAGKTHEFVRIKEGSNTLDEEDQRLQLLTALDGFLAKNNPTDVLLVK
ncbi:MAG: S9 family peptidase [Gammaproteobacteria bacterium PRO9]|nr:S9 family peptidase [Gammaproteobacteria bacterium PRO9]